MTTMPPHWASTPTIIDNFSIAFIPGQHPGSFARGVPFQENSQTGDMRIAGTLASLAGLERAIEMQDEQEIELSIKRMLLLQGITLSIGGVPLLYLGEEWGMLNDYDFVKDPAKAGDTRWVHRPKMQWEFLDELETPGAVSESLRVRIFRSLQKLIATRRRLPGLAGQSMDLISTRNAHVLGFVRTYQAHRVVVLANFSENAQSISGNDLRTAGLGRFFEDALSGESYATSKNVDLQAYDFLWLQRI